MNERWVSGSLKAKLDGSNVGGFPLAS